MKKLSIYIILITGWLLLSGCPEDKPPVEKRDTTIQLSEVSTVIFSTNLKVSVTDTSDSWVFELIRDDSTILISEVFTSDTIIKDNALQNAMQYTYRAYWLIDSERADSSEMVTITTGDTTSHNFIWEIDTLGDYGSYLNDVAIVDENNIWVVGNIETDSATYNAAHWNGEEWEMIRIIISAALNSIFYFSEDDIWVLGSWPFHWDGSEWTMYHLENMGIIPGGLGGEIWGTSSSNMYFVGRYGRIVHYNGSSFTKMESGTDVDLTDIWSVIDEETGNETKYVCGFTQFDETVILRNTFGTWDRWFNNPYEEYIDLYPDKVSGPVISIWTNDPDYLWAITYWGLYKINTAINTDFIRYPDQNAWGGYINKIRGNNSNDILFAGYESSVWHYNGESLSKIEELDGDIVIRNIEILENLVYLCGEDYQTDRAIFIKGKRY